MTNPIIPFPQITDNIIRKSFDEFPGVRWIKDHAGRVTWVSPNYQALTGIDPANVLHRTVSEIFGPEIGAEFEEMDRRARETGSTVVDTVAAPCGGKLIWLQWVTPLSGGGMLGSAVPRA